MRKILEEETDDEERKPKGPGDPINMWSVVIMYILLIWKYIIIIIANLTRIFWGP